MSWVRLDDQFHDDPDLDVLSCAAITLHICATSYCARNETDGVIPKARVYRLKGGNSKAIAELVAIGWWIENRTENERDSYLIRSFCKYNPSHAQLNAKRTATKHRVGRWRNGGVNTPCNAVTDSVTGCYVTPLQVPCNASGNAGCNTAPVPVPDSSHKNAQNHPPTPNVPCGDDAASPLVCEDSVSGAVPSSKPHAPKHKPEQARLVYAGYPGNRDARDFALAWDKIKPTDADVQKMLLLFEPFRGLKLTDEEKVGCGAIGPFIRQGKWKWDLPFPGYVVQRRKRVEHEEIQARVNGYANGNGSAPSAPAFSDEQTEAIFQATYGRGPS